MIYIINSVLVIFIATLFLLRIEKPESCGLIVSALSPLYRLMLTSAVLIMIYLAFVPQSGRTLLNIGLMVVGMAGIVYELVCVRKKLSNATTEDRDVLLWAKRINLIAASGAAIVLGLFFIHVVQGG